jgi:FkbM family methyltransferase
MITGALEGLLRRTANRLGIDIHRYRPEILGSDRLTAMLASHGVDLVFDVGANTGQFGWSLRQAGYEGRLVSFEPLSSAYARLRRAAQGDGRWEIAPRVAIGDHEGEIEMRIARNSVSSSALDMLDIHATAAPDSGYVGKERVCVSRLDTLARGYLEPGSVPFIKIDTQGYEDRVLNGATELLGKVRGLQLELSLVPLYEGQQLFDVLVERLSAMGFSIWAIWPGFCDPGSGRMLQVDATFFRG